jgi:ribonuclease III
LGISRIIREKPTPEQQALSKTLFNVFGIKTGNIYIYELALRHKSAATEIKAGLKDSYERLEFLGDAILGAVIAEYLFKKYPFRSEGFLTDLRSKIVCGKFLTKIAHKLGINRLITIQNNNPSHSASGTLEDVVEALIGAMFIDKGFETTRKVIIERIVEIHVDIEALVETETNFKSRLIEWAQREKHTVTFSIKDTKINKGQKQYTIEVLINDSPVSEAVNNSIKAGEQHAAEKAIELLKAEGKYQ